MKNARHNYSPCERDVREATSSDKALAPAIVQARIANATYSPESRRQVMTMIWKRLHDSGKQWRHVYKSLLLLEFLLKTAAEDVVAEVKANIFSIQVLQDFQHLGKSGKDKGVNVREHAKSLVALLQNDMQLHSEREIGVRNHQRFTELMGDRALAKAPKNKGKAPHPNAPVPQPHPAGGAPPQQPQQPQHQPYTTQPGPHNPAGPPGQYTHPHPPGHPQQGRPPPQQMPTVSTGQAEARVQTEEQMLAMALRMSSLEADGMQRRQAEEREQQELAIALSLSMAEAEGMGTNTALDSSDDDSEPTPPSTPYGGEFFGAFNGGPNQAPAPAASAQGAGTGYLEMGPDAGDGGGGAGGGGIGGSGYLEMGPDAAPGVGLPSYDEALSQPTGQSDQQGTELEQYLQQDGHIGGH